MAASEGSGSLELSQSEGGAAPAPANGHAAGSGGAAAEGQPVSVALSSLVCCALSTRFHGSAVSGAWDRVSGDGEVVSLLGELDAMQAAAGGSGSGGRRAASKPRAQSGYQMGLALAAREAKADPAVVALLRRLPPPKSGVKDANGEVVAAMSAAVRTAAWKRMPEEDKAAFMPTLNAACAQLPPGPHTTEELRAALAAYCANTLHAPVPDVYRRYKPHLLAVLQARLDEGAAAAAGGGGAAAAAPAPAAAPAAAAPKKKSKEAPGGDHKEGSSKKKHKKHHKHHKADA